MTRYWLLVFTVCFANVSLAWQSEGKKAESSSDAAFGTPPLVRLIRDPKLRTELAISAEQETRLEALLAKVDNPLWRIRDYPMSKVVEKAKPLISEFQKGVIDVLDDSQASRLKQIVRQIQSWRGLLEPEMAKELNLTARQIDALKTIFVESDDRVSAIENEVKKSGAKPTDAHQKRLRETKELERNEVAKLLSPTQQTTLTQLVGEPFDFTKLKGLWTKAPEFEASTVWRQTKPLKMADQRGKVVVVHFFAFGCINCIHNYPWYRDWTKKYSPSEVTIVGIHTPETTAEQSVSTLEKKLQENELTFPIAVDNDKANWNAWGNNMWPSVYLIDKDGYVRAWWYGELDWRGAGGQKIMEQRIDELLKEKPR